MGSHPYSRFPDSHEHGVPRRAGGLAGRLFTVVFVLVITVGALAAGYVILVWPGQQRAEEQVVGASTVGPTASPDEGGPQGDARRTPRLGLEFHQDDRPGELSFDIGAEDPRASGVALASGPFELRLPALEEGTALQLCAWTDDSVFSLSTGVAVEDTGFFAPGTGAADTEYGSGTLFLGDDRHNHLVDTRLIADSDTVDSVYFSTVFHDGEPVPLEEWDQPLYLAVLIDENGDGVVDNSEYEYLTLSFGQ